jgi:cell division protease FtsH
MDAEERRIVAFHESGHALVAWLTPGADPVHKITIVPHGQALGVTEQLPAIERHNLSRAYLLTRIAVMLGGRTAEEVVFDEITTGAENDLVEATQLARQMVTRWGMSDIGLAAFRADESQPFLGYELTQGRDYSEATAARVDASVQQLLSGAHEGVLTLLRASKNQLETLAEALLRDETLELSQLNTILGPPHSAAGDKA